MQIRENSEWINFNWKAIENRVKFLRYRIFNATQKKDISTTCHLQYLMLNSSANILLSIRKVTALNQRLSGIDKIRIHLIHDLMSLNFSDYTPISYKNLSIPKTHRKQKLLKIQIIKDQCIQLIIKNALEPEWEAKFEDTSYGSRPGRCSHDAINHMTQIIKKYPEKACVMTVNLTGDLGLFNGEIILKRITNFPRIDLVFKWIKADYLKSYLYQQTEAGLPQGDIISSLLGNIALDELDKIIKSKYLNTNFHHFYVRYNESFLIFYSNQKQVNIDRDIIARWLKKAGISSSVQQFQINNVNSGFDFLDIQVFPRKYDTVAITVGPNKRAIQNIRSKLKAIWMRGRGKDVQWVLDKINPRVREWCSYFSFYKSSKIFKDLDNWMFHRSVRYCKRTHPNKSWGWMQQKYFGRFNAKKNSKWIFGDKETGKYLIRFSWTPVRHYIPIQTQASPDNIIYYDYWFKRNASGISNNQLWNISDVKIAHRQSHMCPICEESLYNQEPIEKHHIILNRSTKRIYSFNMVFVHSICYQCIKQTP
mmetsp:Transcript_45201/g.175518  ORF Transcript_45201/g.175518 Transcript_45201/m.175518 type:complete len:536 (-) Transcript_45201:2278-3885(-)